tara:strand:- start:9 stop:773 length:765 start_codon:yes stop_codon:yes gene_type:complete
MVDYKVSPADQEILKTITAKSTWNDLTVSFRNKILPAGNLNKAIGERCAKLLKSLIKKDKVSSSTLSKGCPLLTKKIIKTQNTSIAKAEIKSSNSAAKRRGGGGGSSWNKGSGGKAPKTGSKDEYYEKLVNEIVKKQLDAEKQILAGQVETVNKVLVDTRQPQYTKEQQREFEKEFNEEIDSKYTQYQREGGRLSRHDFLINEADREAQENQVNNAYESYMNDDYSEFVIPQQPVVIPPYSVENDPIFQDPRNM